MRIKEIKCYEFNELSDEAKEKAIESFTYDMEYFGSDQALESIKQGLRHFDASLDYYSIDWLNANASHFKISINEEIGLLSFVRLWKYINQNYRNYYCKYDKKIKPLLPGSCPFTGVYFDEEFLDEIREFMKKPDHRTFKGLLFNAVQNVLQAAEREFEHQQSEEYLLGHFNAIEYEFDEYGNMM